MNATRKTSAENKSGYVYIASMEGVRGRLKIGMSSGDPHERVADWGGDTGAPGKAILQYYAHVRGDPKPIETEVHRALESKRKKGEWFETGLETAIQKIREIAGDVILDEYDPKGAEHKAKRAETKKPYDYQQEKARRKKKYDYPQKRAEERRWSQQRRKEKVGKIVLTDKSPERDAGAEQRARTILIESGVLEPSTEQVEQIKQRWLSRVAQLTAADDTAARAALVAHLQDPKSLYMQALTRGATKAERLEAAREDGRIYYLRIEEKRQFENRKRELKQRREIWKKKEQLRALAAQKKRDDKSREQRQQEKQPKKETTKEIQRKRQEWAIRKEREEKEIEDSYYINKTWRKRIGKIIGYGLIVVFVLALLSSP